MLHAGVDRQEGVIMLLASMLKAAHAFVAGISDSLAREGAQNLEQLPAAIYAPFYSQLDRLLASTKILK